MNYINERRQEEKERRRAEIIDAAVAVASEVRWDDMTMDQVARKARLSRALVYVYFQDKQDLMFAVNERALIDLERRFIEARNQHTRGIDQIEAMGRAYVAFSEEEPVYFEVLSRCEQMTANPDPDTNAGNCLKRGNAVHAVIIEALETGMRDGSIRKDAGPPEIVCFVLWGFMHGLIQIATNKANVLIHRGVSTGQLLEQALTMARRSLEPPH